MSVTRPPHQRWIKRPPRPSQAVPPPQAARKGPGMGMFLLTLGFAVLAGMLGAVLAPRLIPDRPGMGGLFAGLGFAIAFFSMWRGLGGTRQDIKDLFR